jgi:hypothetical protein
MSGPNEDSVEGTVPHVERRLAAILSADVKGYSRLMGNNDVGGWTRAQAERHTVRRCASVREHERRPRARA